MTASANPELDRLRRDGGAWKRWGPYLSDRSWGGVREDLSETGDAWKDFPHDHARARAYRWGEDGIAGISDQDQLLCFALALWNGRDAILKERLFGLDNAEGNHGEDAKEYWFHLDSTPTHSSMRMLYKYPQAAFPYERLVAENAARSKKDPEFELADTGVFAEGRYFDVEVEYAKAGPEDICIRIAASNRGPEAAELHLLPTLWFRNTWSWGPDRQVGSGAKPVLRAGGGRVQAEHELLGAWELACAPGPDGAAPALLACENESNRQRLWQRPNHSPTAKDGINDRVVGGRVDAVAADGRGSKAAAWYRLRIEAGATAELSLRLRRIANADSFADSFADHAAVLAARRREADAFYRDLQPAGLDDDRRAIQRRAWAGMLWTKQWFALDVPAWSRQQGEDGAVRSRLPRNQGWHHFSAADVMSMPDKWEYPWFAAWDLAFHTIALAYVDADFAKNQLLLLLDERFQAPNGAVPAYEWNFDDCNPPVLARAVWRVYAIERARGRADAGFLATAFQKLGAYFTWWVNRKDATGSNLFQGGFLGLDNIGVFDRSKPLPTGGHIEQSDGTAWMGVFALDMALIAVELSHQDAAYGAMARRYAVHAFYLGVSLNNVDGNITGRGVDLWDEADGFYYDVLRLDERAVPLKVRSLVGLIPLYATIAFPQGAFEHLGMQEWLRDFARTRPRIARVLAELVEPGEATGVALVSLTGRARMLRILARMLDEAEFLSPYGIRGLSRHHAAHPYTFFVGGTPFSVGYVPGDSDSFLFGGNSNWRGPVWMPVNYFLVTALKRWHRHLGDGVQVEFPTGSGRRLHLGQVADELAGRLVALFARDPATGRRPVLGGPGPMQDDPHWRDHIPFCEYFHGDDGRGLGATHQTGWTGLVAALIQELAEDEAVPMPPRAPA